MRLGRRHQANKEMAFHALDVLHAVVWSSETGRRELVASTFEPAPPLPCGHVGYGAFGCVEEAAALAE